MRHPKAYNKPVSLIFALGALVVLAMVAILVWPQPQAGAQGFNGPPGGAPGSGYGAIGVDTFKNLSIGTSTVYSDTKLFILAPSSASSAYAISVRNPPSSPIFTVRNDGKVFVGTSYYIPGGSVPFVLSVQGDSYFNGTVSSSIFANGTLTGTVNATNVTPGTFAGNYAVNGNLGVNYLSAVGLPQTLSVTGSAYIQNNVGIGSTSPTYVLDVVGGANFTGTVKAQTPSATTDLTTKSYVDSAVSSASNAQNCSAGATCSMNGANLNSGNITNVNKLTVATIDPLYEIAGKRYATYSPGMTGVKEETTGILHLLPQKNGTYSATLNFYGGAEGSDLWLFAHTANLKKDISEMTVTALPAFEGNVWYEKNPNATQLSFYARPVSGHPESLEISYHLIAPRFDSHLWLNTSSDYLSSPLRP